MSLDTQHLNDREHRALTAILDRLVRLEGEARLIRSNLAYELGFDRKDPSQLVKGDEVRSPHGGFRAVSCKRWVDDGDHQGYFVTFDDMSTAFYEVASESHPVPTVPVTVAVDPDETWGF